MEGIVRTQFQFYLGIKMKFQLQHLHEYKLNQVIRDGHWFHPHGPYHWVVRRHRMEDRTRGRIFSKSNDRMGLHAYISWIVNS